MNIVSKRLMLVTCIVISVRNEMYVMLRLDSQSSKHTFRKDFVLYHKTQLIHSEFFYGLCNPTRVMASSFLRFLDHTQRRTTVGRTPLYERSARRKDLYLTTHNNHNKHPCHGRNSNPRSQ
jgi:hypothetical protein